MARILIVDDDDDFREMLRMAATALGHDVSAARDGNEALRLCACESPDLVLTDLVMPEREGLKMIQVLRRDWPQLKIIAMSSGARMNARDLLKVAKLMGAREVLTKPFSIQELTLVI